MAQPPAYARAFSFTDWTAAHPNTPQPGVSLDTEFNHIATSVEGIRDNLVLIQRDDGALANGVVTADALSSELTIGLRSVTDWSMATAYEIADGVWEENKLYRSLENHTSAAAFATDLAAGKWELLVDMAAYAAAAATIAVTDEVLAGIELDVDLGPINAALATKAGLTDANAFTLLQSFGAGFRSIVNTSVTQADYWQARPTDYGAGKPAALLRKTTAAGVWQFRLDDGAAGTGFALDVIAPGGALRVNGSDVWHAGNFDPTTKAAATDLAAIAIMARRAKRYAAAF